MAEDRTNRRKQLDDQIEGEGTPASGQRKEPPPPERKPSTLDKARLVVSDSIAKATGVDAEQKKAIRGFKSGGLVTRAKCKHMGKAC